MLKNCSDNKLAILAKKNSKKYLYVFYMRYRKYGYSIIESLLRKTFYYNALAEEKDTILIDSIVECINDFAPERGEFKCLLNSIISHKTCKVISEFSKDALADYVSLDTFKFKGDLLFADSNSIGPISPNKVLEENESKILVSSSYHPRSKKIKYIVELKNKGYSYGEIAEKANKSETAIKQLFYRIRKNVNKQKNR